MKIIITLLLALFISGQAYAQSATKIMELGETIHEEVMDGITLYTKLYYHAFGDKKGQTLFYKCLMNRQNKPYLWCWEYEDRGIIDPQ